MTDTETRNLVREWEHRRDVASEPAGTGSVAAKGAGGVRQGAETMTKAQERALRWLPADGAWKSLFASDAPRWDDFCALRSLGLVTEVALGRFRLTPCGIARRAAL